MIAFSDPLRPALPSGGRGPCPRCGSTSRVCERKSQTSPLRPPKGTDPGPCELFPLQNRHFQGPPEGAMIAIVDPMQPDAVMVGEGHAPVVAGSPALRRSYNKRLQGKA